ncbi:Bulb-type lectin domain [Dillenia turbinata]|uniref:Receptor-like serine/threonine-protein kinase n=1 Tax=Dillenia turbinata TaxID=194707 RepID=A0AAN8YWR2_9MAGN
MKITWSFSRPVPLILIISSSLYLINGESFDYPEANLSTSWTNSPSAPHSVNFSDGSTVRSILLRGSFGPRYACGFFCNGSCDTYLFAIFIVQTDSASYITMPSIGFPQVVWSANRDRPVRLNATLLLKSDGDLVLQDVDGTVAWSTNTSAKSIAGLNLTETGNLVLFDEKGTTIWQSFDHPTDVLVPGQSLVIGNYLTASVSNTNWTNGGLYSLSVTSEGLFAYVGSNPPQAYYFKLVSGNKTSNVPSYVKFLNGSLALFVLSAEPSEPDEVISVPQASSAQYMKLGSDGHLRVYQWGDKWAEVADLLTGYLGECNYPLVCGTYGICSNNGQCSCPASANGGTSYFRQKDYRQPSLGCSEITPLTCVEQQNHELLELDDIRYFIYDGYNGINNPDMTGVDMESCKQGCLRNCSCKAALFQYGYNSSNGDCYLPSEVFSLMNNVEETTHYNSSAFLKVQNVQSGTVPKKKTSHMALIAGLSVGVLSTVACILGILMYLYKRGNSEEAEEDYLDQVPGLPTRFSYEVLKSATSDFSKKLGEGGFGSVYEGTLGDGTKVAVKLLEGLGQVKKSFLVEVEIIGSIHHVNLVRLIGFCADKSHRLLVYEFMCNGSLDKWIFPKNQAFSLDWKHRWKIIFDIARGLAYLHEDCRQKIIHLDIKPQNILLDESFNAKVSDFGLSKLIDKDQSQVMTAMRGTPGYLAPEWLSSIITEKVDVYGFGVVVLEIVCGRKNLDRYQPEEGMHLLSLFKQKLEEDRLMDMVDKHNEDMQYNEREIVKVMRLAAWCLQSDFTKRPSMSMVVKVMEGVMDVEENLDYGFSFSQLPKPMEAVGRIDAKFAATSPLLPSVLSGPR